MRAGQLHDRITIQRRTSTVDDFGTPIETWADLATARASVIQSSTQEFMAAIGQTGTIATIFRLRYLDGITTADRVSHDGRFYDIKEVKELGRRAGMDLRCTAPEA